MGNLALMAIRLYRLVASPIFSSMGGGCRFHPSCSKYAEEAYKRYGWWKATCLSIWRVMRCNPFNGGGVEELK